MKKVVFHILVLTYCAHLLMPLIVVVDYEVRKDYIASAFCENKDLPELNCNGKCFLSKKLKKLEQEREQQQEKRIKLILSQGDYVANRSFEFNPSLGVLQNKWKGTSDEHFKDLGFIHVPFKPPRFNA